MSNQFTNGLNIGGAVSISDKLLDYGVNYILPVAGVQGFDTLREVKKFGSNAWVIGVDTNFAILFPDYNDLIIFSAVKRCDLAVLYSLWDGFKISAKEEKQEKYGNKNSSNKFFTLGRSFLYTTEEKGIINGLVSGNVWNFNRFFDDLFSDPRIISLQQNALSFVQLHPTDL